MSFIIPEKIRMIRHFLWKQVMELIQCKYCTEGYSWLVYGEHIPTLQLCCNWTQQRSNLWLSSRAQNCSSRIPRSRMFVRERAMHSCLLSEVLPCLAKPAFSWLCAWYGAGGEMKKVAAQSIIMFLRKCNPLACSVVRWRTL